MFSHTKIVMFQFLVCVLKNGINILMQCIYRQNAGNIFLVIQTYHVKHIIGKSFIKSHSS